MPMMIPETLAKRKISKYRKSIINNTTISETDPNTQPTRSKSTISSILFSTFSPTNTPSSDDHRPTAATPPKKKNFASSKFRGMGCTTSSQVSVPAVIKTSASCETKKVKKKKQRNKKGKLGFSSFDSKNNSNNNSNLSSPSLAVSSSCVAVPDAWCGPRNGFTPDSSSVHCVVSRKPDRGKVDGERRTYIQRPSYPVRRMVSPEDIPFIAPDATLGVSQSRLDMSRSRHRHGQHGYPDGLEEIMMLQSSLLMGGRPSRLDRYRDWRLDVDNMTYEELLELGDRMGHVCTGLKDHEIARCLRKTKLSGDNSAPHITTEMEKKCSICQEEYEADDEMGKLKCGHFYHIDCIKQWLEQKNCCPICKTSAASYG